MRDLAEEIISTIRRNKLRTSLTGFAVAWGIFMLIVLLGAGNGVIHAFEHQSANMKMNAITIYPGMTSEAYHGLNKGRSIALNEKDVTFSQKKFDKDIVEAGATCSKSGTLLSHGKENLSITLDGVLPNYLDLQAVKMKEGRFINERDLTEKRKVIILHEKTAGILFPQTKKIVGEQVKAFNISYQIVGIYTDQNAFSPSALIPLPTLQTIYSKGDSIDNITFTTQGIENLEGYEEFSDNYRAALGKEKQFSPTDKGAIWIMNRFKQNVQQQSATRMLHIAIWIIGIFTLLSGIVGVSNIMLITVRERTHEFGIRKALGAKPSSILWLIITESVVITTFFGYIGMVAGVAVTEYMNMVAGEKIVDAGAFSLMVFQNPTVDMSIAIQATITLVVAGTLAGFFPARKAAMIRPIEALRAD